MSDAFVIEINNEAAGIVVRAGRDYRFYASDARYSQLEGTFYSSASKAEEAARRMQTSLRATAFRGPVAIAS